MDRRACSFDLRACEAIDTPGTRLNYHVKQEADRSIGNGNRPGGRYALPGTPDPAVTKKNFKEQRARELYIHSNNVGLVIGKASKIE